MRRELLPFISPAVRPLDLDADPQEIYARLANGGNTVLLESAKLMPGLSGWSYVSGPALATLEARQERTELRPARQGGGLQHALWRDPFEALRVVCGHLRRARETASEQTADRPAGLSFAGGLIGFLGYDLVRHIERLPTLAKADALPDLLLHLTDHVLAFDHANARWYFCSIPWPGVNRTERSAVWAQTLARASCGDDRPTRAFEAGPLTTNLPAAEYLDRVRCCKEYIEAGDVFQVNLSHRLEGRFRGDPFALYQRLTALNPAPFAAYVAGDGFALAGVSPERFLHFDHGIVTARPIKGTRPRGATAALDRVLHAALAASQKDRAENLMIVDLMRNDLGRVAQTGSVRVDKLFEIEAHPSVWQMVSTIRARLREGAGAADLLRACWPPGSMTGAPKVRAMQIIESLEPVRRGPYAGAIGYFDVSGAMDLSVVIRTVVVHGDRASVQLGGAVVADSNPEAELAETYAKGRLLLGGLNSGSGPPH